MNHKALTGESIRDSFNKFNHSNPHIYKVFEEQVLAAILAGKTKVSAKLIINWIRNKEEIKTGGKNFKINDAFQSYYPRLFAHFNPQHAGVFEFRKQRNEQDGPYIKVDPKTGQISFF